MSQSLLLKGKAASVLPFTIYAKELDVEMTTTADYDATFHSMQEVYFLQYHLLVLFPFAIFLLLPH
jgi:hypothetical protein